MPLSCQKVEAMYATIGYIVPEYYKFPGYLSPSLGLKFADVPNGLAAFVKVKNLVVMSKLSPTFACPFTMSSLYRDVH